MPDKDEQDDLIPPDSFVDGLTTSSDSRSAKRYRGNPEDPLDDFNPPHVPNAVFPGESPLQSAVIAVVLFVVMIHYATMTAGHWTSLIVSFLACLCSCHGIRRLVSSQDVLTRAGWIWFLWGLFCYLLMFVWAIGLLGFLL